MHAGKLVDMKSAAARTNVDIVIEGNKITSVVPHADANHTGQVVDASNLTVMPGLIEFHSHLQPDFGESAGRAWLAFGITTVRSPGQHAVRAGGGARGQRGQRPIRARASTAPAT